MLNELLKRGCLPDKKAFALSVGCSTSMITEISKGRSNVGVSVLQNTVQNYGVSATWLLVGTGEMFVSEEQETHNNSSAEPMVDKLLGIIQQQAEDIGQLRAELAQLKQRLQKKCRCCQHRTYCQCRLMKRKTLIQNLFLDIQLL